MTVSQSLSLNLFQQLKIIPRGTSKLAEEKKGSQKLLFTQQKAGKGAKSTKERGWQTESTKLNRRNHSKDISNHNKYKYSNKPIKTIQHYPILTGQIPKTNPHMKFENQRHAWKRCLSQ